MPSMQISTSLIGLILAVLILYLVRRDHLYLMHGVWWSLAQEYQAVDVVAALGVQVRVVAESLVVTNQRRYRPAAADLGRLCRVAREAGSAEALALVDGAIAELRER